MPQRLVEQVQHRHRPGRLPLAKREVFSSVSMAAPQTVMPAAFISLVELVPAVLGVVEQPRHALRRASAPPAGRA